MAPIGLFLVTVMLFFFRRVYCEVVTAIPINGGSYNIMLNTSSKRLAAIVGCLSLLSYTATAIVSAFDAILYLSIIWTSVGRYAASCYNNSIHSYLYNMITCIYRCEDRHYCGARGIWVYMLLWSFRII